MEDIKNTEEYYDDNLDNHPTYYDGITEDDDSDDRYYYELDDVEKEKIDKKVKSDYTCFMIEDMNFFPCKRTMTNIPCGYYRIRKDYTKGIFLRKQDVNLSKLVLLEHCPLHKTLMDSIIHFWNSKEEYQKRGKIYKKNILLYSAPGMGKTSLINLVIDDLIKNRNGFVIALSDENDILNFNEIMSYIRAIMPERPIVVVIEDFDNFCGGNKSAIETELLNILDGNQKYSNMVIIATTNYPETLNDRYINRPSRFNLLLEYPYPDADLRREFLIKTNLKEDIDKIDLDYIVKRTEGYTIDFLNELSMSIFINHEDIETALSKMDNMISNKVIKYQKPTHSRIGIH